MKRWLAFSLWGYLTWILLTWTATTEQLVFGAILAAIAGFACFPLGEAAGPWRILQPRRLLRTVRIGAYVAVHLVKANLALSRRIWSPARPLAPGMVIVTTELRSEGGLAAIGILSSLIVDNQIIDLDRPHRLLQYHGVAVGPASPEEHRRAITGPLEDLIQPLEAP
jgi:multicomponent Na+:H+ antiporter subunit E